GDRSIVPLVGRFPHPRKPPSRQWQIILHEVKSLMSEQDWRMQKISRLFAANASAKHSPILDEKQHPLPNTCSSVSGIDRCRERSRRSFISNSEDGKYNPPPRSTLE